MESRGSNEFLLGIEEYLVNLGCRDQAVKIHSLATALSHSAPKQEITRLFFQECCQHLTDNANVELSDLVHKFNKSQNNTEIKDCVLTYLMQLYSEDNVSLADVMHKFVKAEEKTELKDALLIYIMNQKTSVEVYLSDLIHKIMKSDNNDTCKEALLTFTMNQFIQDQPLKDFVFKSTKNLSIGEHHRSLLQFLSHRLKDNNLIRLCHHLYKSTDNEDFSYNFVKNEIGNLENEFPGDKFFRGINSCIKNSHLELDVINDAFSRSQIKSKFWLIKELEKIQRHYVNVLVLAGWFGQTKSIYEKFCTYQKMRILDLDRNACEVSDYVFNLSNLENHKVKSISADINNLVLHKNGYEWTIENFKEPEKNYSEKFLPNLIINTSAEHMTEEWFHQIRFKQLESDPIVAIQSNNMFGIDEHVNCVHSIDHMKKKFPMKEVLYEGELQLKGYKRVMLIGRP